MDSGNNQKDPVGGIKAARASSKEPLNAGKAKPFDGSKKEMASQSAKKIKKKESPGEAKQEIPELDENEKSDAKSEMYAFYTPQEIAKPLCPRGAIVQASNGIVTTEEAVKGDFGSIRCRLSSFPDKERFLMRYEKRTLPFRRLKTEVGVFMMAKLTENSRLFPHIHTRGTLMGSHIFFVCDMLGHNLTVQRILCGGRFNLTTAYRLATSTLSCIITLHEMGFIHRDIKPSVFTVSMFPNANRIILSSVGLAKEMHQNRYTWRPRSYVSFLGTVQYSSRRNHRHMEQVFSDDLESWFYMVCEWIDPAIISWGKDGDKERVLKAKEDFMNAEKGFKEALRKQTNPPGEFEDIVHYVRSLSGELIIPQKTFIAEIVKKVQKRLKLQEDAPFQWCKNL